MGLFIGQSYFFNDVAQLYLIFQPLYYTLWSSSTGKFVSWKSKGLSTEKLLVMIIVFLEQLNAIEIQIFV